MKNFREKQVDGNVAALLDELNKNFAKLADDLSASKASKGNLTAANQLRKELYDIRLWPQGSIDARRLNLSWMTKRCFCHRRYLAKEFFFVRHQ